MPIIEDGKTIEEIYLDHVRNMSPRERFDRIFSLFGSCYRSLALRLQREHPEMGERQIRIELAKRLYGGDPRTMELIKQCENDEHFSARVG